MLLGFLLSSGFSHSHPVPGSTSHSLFSPNGRIELREGGVMGSTDLYLDAERWFGAGAPTSFRANGAALNLGLTLTTDSTGHDALGYFVRRAWSWCAGVCSDPNPSDLHFETAARAYDAAVVYEQRWLNATSGASFPRSRRSAAPPTHSFTHSLSRTHSLTSLARSSLTP